ncbi:hypothetical protein D3C75_780390 [compost metagenome]
MPYIPQGTLRPTHLVPKPEPQLICLSTTVKSPIGVGVFCLPIATGYALLGIPSTNTASRWACGSMTMETSPSGLLIGFGCDPSARTTPSHCHAASAAANIAASASTRVLLVKANLFFMYIFLSFPPLWKMLWIKLEYPCWNLSIPNRSPVEFRKMQMLKNTKAYETLQSERDPQSVVQVKVTSHRFHATLHCPRSASRFFEGANSVDNPAPLSASNSEQRTLKR